MKALSSTRLCQQEVDLGLGRSAFGQGGTNAPGALAIVDGLAFQAELLDVGETQAQVDHLDAMFAKV